MLLVRDKNSGTVLASVVLPFDVQLAENRECIRSVEKEDNVFL